MIGTYCPQCSCDEVIGVEKDKVYAGTLFWVCANPNCHYAWPRRFPAQPSYRKLAKRYAREHNLSHGFTR
jgi:hypothetical protein